jgi:hypothetical protein
MARDLSLRSKRPTFVGDVLSWDARAWFDLEMELHPAFGMTPQ